MDSRERDLVLKEIELLLQEKTTKALLPILQAADPSRSSADASSV